MNEDLRANPPTPDPPYPVPLTPEPPTATATAPDPWPPADRLTAATPGPRPPADRLAADASADPWPQTGVPAPHRPTAAVPVPGPRQPAGGPSDEHPASGTSTPVPARGRRLPDPPTPARPLPADGADGHPSSAAAPDTGPRLPSVRPAGARPALSASAPGSQPPGDKGGGRWHPTGDTPVPGPQPHTDRNPVPAPAQPAPDAPADSATAGALADPSAEPAPGVPAAPVPRPRRRGPGPVTLLVLPCLVALPGVAGFLALNGGFPPDWAQDSGPRHSDANSLAESYLPWLRKAADGCGVVTPSLLAAQIDQLSGWRQQTAAPSDDEGIAGYSTAEWKTWGKDADGNGRSSPAEPADAISALGRQDCSLAAKVTGLRTDGRINGDLVDLTLAAYATGTDTVTEAGRVPAGASTYVSEVKALLPRYQGFDQTAAAAGTAAPVAPADAVLSPPLAGGLTVTSPFGTRKHPLTGVTKLHTGVDFAATRGTQVYAAREGRVVFAAFTKAYGNRVVVDHGTIAGKPLQTTYSHLSALQVTAGQSVQAGTPVGLAGSTGLSTGPHLHFEVIYDGSYNDPLPWLGVKSGT